MSEQPSGIPDTRWHRLHDAWLDHHGPYLAWVVVVGILCILIVGGVR